MNTEQRKQFEQKARMLGYTNFSMRDSKHYNLSELNLLVQGYMMNLSENN